MGAGGQDRLYRVLCMSGYYIGCCLYYTGCCICIVQGAEEQLKEVWEESDGLNKKDFDPRTFFYLHGLSVS